MDYIQAPDTSTDRVIRIELRDSEHAVRFERIARSLRASAHDSWQPLLAAVTVTADHMQGPACALQEIAQELPWGFTRDQLLIDILNACDVMENH